MKRFILGRKRIEACRRIAREHFNKKMFAELEADLHNEKQLRAEVRSLLVKEGYSSVWMTLLIGVIVELIKFWLDGGFDSVPFEGTPGQPY